MNSSAAALRGRKGLHQKNLSTQIAPTSDHQFNLKMKNPAKGGQDSGSDMYNRTGGRGSKSKASGINDAGKDYAFQGGPIHVPRKFARKHARGASFNSTGKGLNDREEEAPPAVVRTYVYDKATLEAEKERERRRKQLGGNESNELSEPYLAEN